MAKATTRRPKAKEPEQLSPFDPVRRGKHPGGRPPKGPRSSERHEVRPELEPDQPVHIVLRVADHVGQLRQRAIYDAIREATATVAERHEHFRIVHASIQGNHLHLIVEASDRMKLARGMQAFQISAAQRINRALSALTGEKIRGQVFPDRYHATILTSPRMVRAALAFVLNSWRHRGEDRRGEAKAWAMDPYSSASYFDGWKDREGVAPAVPEGEEPLVVSFPKGWLLSTGWRRHGLISVHEVPDVKPRKR